MAKLHPLLARQLEECGWTDPRVPPDAAVLRRLFERIAETYGQSEQERRDLKRSLDISSLEMREVNEKLHVEHGPVEIACRV